jgi:signal transduction histidine kinase
MVAGDMEKKKVGIFGVGVFLFLASFSWGNLFGSLTLQWGLEQYGLFGMPIFIGFLAYLIVKYQAFDMKLAGAQALVAGLILLIGSQFFFIKTTINFFLTGITLVMAMGFGWMLIRSVKKEIERRDQLQEMSDRLARANDELRKLDNAKSEFISIASHQLRTPLTAIKGFISLILEGSYGKISPEIQDILNKVYASNDRIVQLVENLLNISRIESGRIQYQFEKASIETILKELSDMFFVMTQGRNLTLTFTLPKEKLPLIYMDAPKIREVISNLIDNALKYTEKGGIEVILEQRGPMARITVADTGMGVEPAMIEHLFSKFIRGSKEASRMNVAGTGLGLYVGRSFVEAHHGKIWIESEGLGKGSKFIVELPIV